MIEDDDTQGNVGMEWLRRDSEYNNYSLERFFWNLLRNFKMGEGYKTYRRNFE